MATHFVFLATRLVDPSCPRGYLLLRHYDAVRRAVSYLRWNEGDADAIAPSLYAGRKEKRSKSDTVANATTEPAAPAVPPTPTAPGGNGTAGAPREMGNPAMPGGSPFMQ